MNLARVFTVAQREWREILRDRIYFLLAFLLPVMLMLVFGYGMSQDIENIAFAVVDEDHTPMSRDYAHHFIESRYFSFKGYLPDAGAADRLLARRKLRMVIVIGPRFAEQLRGGRTARIQTLIDGTFTTSTRTIQAYVEAINLAANAEIRAGQLARRLGLPPQRVAALMQPVVLDVRYLYNQEVRSIWAVAPGLIMLILMLVPPLLMALSVVREKETGAIYNVCSSTITRAEYLTGKLLPSVAISCINAVILWLLATLYFGAPFKGSLVFFAVATLLYILCTTALGLLISLLVRTQQAAMIISLVMSIIVSIQFSGLITPVSALAGANYAFAHAFPAMYYNAMVKGAFLKAVGFEVLWPQLLVFVLYASAVFFMCYLLFRKRTRT
ncbi:MAG: ABC transporter permease [Burkholderiales bacterium]|nr:ABC transporter permease [Burkholderiales bacterium]